MMELISNKISKIAIRRSQKEDLKNILEFHRNQIPFAQPRYLQNALESFSGISLIAYEEDRLLGHTFLIPLSSQRNLNVVESALVCGVWTLDMDVAELLIKEAIMSAWESGFHAVFSFENHLKLKKAGFAPVRKDFFSIGLSNYDAIGMELSWNGFKIITKDLILPRVYLPSVDKLNHFSNN